MKYSLLPQIIFLLLATTVGSQNISVPEKKLPNLNQDTVIKTTNKLLLYPIVYYLPETRLGVGAAGFYSFRFKGETPASNPSQIQISVNYTLNKQLILSFPYELYLGDNKWKFKGELGYYKYQYYYFGIGDYTKKEDKENFRANHPRIRLDILRKWKKMFIGIRYKYDQFDITRIKKDGLLEADLVNKRRDGRLSGLGIIAQLDTRNYIYNPTKGSYVETEFFVSDTWTGGIFKYNRWSIDAAKYFPLAEEHTLALNLYTGNISGDALFYDYLFFGSPKLMRGYTDRRYLDKNIFIFQTEYRFPIYRRMQGVTFAGIGDVASKYKEVFTNRFSVSYGLGLRFLLYKRDRVRLRIDYGLAPREGGAFYVTINDAF